MTTRPTSRRSRFADEADPSTMPYNGLLCAVAACENSVHESDRQFAFDCGEELSRRMNGLPTIPAALREAVSRARTAKAAITA